MIIIEHHYADGYSGTAEVPDGSLRMSKTHGTYDEQDGYMPFVIPPGGRLEAYLDTDPGCPNCGEVGGRPMVREDVDRESGYSAMVDCCSMCAK